ncbi:hypothetical protein KDA14_03670, partial [Candidatus Saccharibacteria bacterium]|nr:hypothetical protein [Candidatus Saccharibacteria bacterium]
IAFALNSRTGGAAVGVYSTVSRSVVATPVTVSADQQIVSLAYAHGVVYAGMTGGSGGAAVVAYDVTTKQVIDTSVPSSNAHRIDSLAASDAGVLYGVADTTLFAIDTDTMNVVKRKSFYATGATGNVVLADGKLTASIAGKIYNVNPQDFKSDYLMNGSHVAVNSFGDYYYSRDGGLYRKLMPREASAASGIRSVGGGVNLSLIDLRFGISSAMLILAIIAIPVLKLHWHRPTYVLRR